MRARLSPLLFVCIALLLIALPLSAQDEQEQPVPQFLYRDEDHLVLLDGYTGEATEFPFDVSNRDSFTWSPDGRYLLSRLADGDNYTACLNLYDVDAQEWLYEKPISCGVSEAIFSADSSEIVYITDDKMNAILCLYSLTDESHRELYRTTDGTELNPASISGIKWSPTGTYLTFESYRVIMGGSLNNFVVMNIESHNYFSPRLRNTYYASYYPIWSADNSWFLITLKDEYVTSGTLPHSNHEGDIYLINSETGEQYRLTFTPATDEIDVHWTEDGQIAFTKVIEQDVTFSIEDAMKVEVIPDEEIVTPEPIDLYEEMNAMSSNDMISPDSSIGAWVSHTINGQELNIGSVLAMSYEAYFSMPLPQSYYGLLIGWRPSDYP